MASTGDDLLPSCLNDPNFAVICAFLQKFSTKLNIVYPDFNDLQKMIENTDEVAEDLKNLIVKLLRKTRKTVHNGKWEHALAKFCYTYSSQDAWEIERFGFKKANLSVKLRVVKEVLESQFERNLKFKTELNLLSAEELRSQPLGKDKLGNAYWSTIDSNLNLRIYQEHLDEDIWKICAHSRDELAKLIACLKGNELVMPSLVGLVDEDSNSMPQVKLDALKNGDVDSDEQNKDPTKPVAEKPKSVEKAEDDEELSDEENESNISEMDVSSQDASESSAPIAETKVNAPVKEKVPPIIVTKTGTAKNLSKTESNSSKLSAKRRLDSESADESASKVPKLQRPTLLSKNQTIKTNKFAHLEGGEDDDRDDDDEDESEEEEEEEEEEEYEEDSSGTEDETDDEEVGDEIVEPVMHVKGLGSGEANEGTFLDLMDLKEENEIGEAIEEDVIFIVGNGSGVENEVGNPENKPKSDKPMFFFGQAGCLKLSPIKVPNLQKMENNIENNVKATNLFNVSTFVDGGGQSSAGLNEIPSNAKNAINEEIEFEKTNENDVDVVKVTQMPNIGEEKSSTTDAMSDSTTVDLAAKMDVHSKQSEIQNPEVVPISEMKDQCSEDIEPTAAPDLAETETIGKTESDDHVNKINDGTLTDIVASPLNILPNESSDTAPATIDEKSIECLETLPSQPILLNTTSDKSIIQDVGEASSDEFVESKDECPDSIAKTEETIEPTHSQDADELIHQLSEPPPDPIQPSEDPENLNVKTCNFIESNSINKDIDTVPESKTENRIESESAVKPIETAIASSDDLMSEKESTAMDVDEKNESSSNAEEDGSADTLQVDEVVNASEQMKIVSASEEMEVVSASEEMEVVSASEEKKVASASEQNEVVSTLEVNQTVSALEVNETIASKVSEMVSTSEVNQLTNETELEQSLEVSKNSGEGTVSPEKSSSAEPLETNSCDSKVDSLIIDSGSCSDYTQRGVEGTSSPTATENDTKEKLIESNQNEAVTTLNSSKKVVYQHQTSQSTTEAEDANCNTSAPENFSTLTATNQSDEIVSEPVIDQLTPDVTSISTPSFDDQDNRTNDSILNDQTVSIETPADISIKEIGKFQIFNRKVDEDPSKRFSEQNDEVANCPPKLQYEGSEETKTPLVLTQPTISEVPPTEHTPKSIDLNKESISSSSLIDKPTDKPELVNPLQSRPSSVEVANSKQDTLTKFPISFNNTHINNRKRPLASKNDFDSDESSSESSEEEVEVKRQKTKPKFSHLAARKNAEIKRKATQIDCSTDEDEPVNPIQLKIISTELSKIENAAKQKKILNDKTPIKLTKDDGPATSLQTIRTSTVKPPVQIESIFGKEKLEPVCLTMPTAKFESKTIPAVESATNLIPEKKAVFENIKHVNAAPTIVNAILSKTLAKTLDDKTLIQEPETSKIDVKSIEEIQPKETIPTVEEIDLKGEIKLKEEVKFMEETKPKDEIKLKEELTLKDEQKLKVETVSVEEKKLKEQIKSRDDPLLKEEAKSKVELKIVPEIESKDETKCTQPTEKEETKMKIELEKTADVKSEPKVENKMEVFTQEKPQTKNEVHDVPQEDLKIISESETTKIETPSTKPGPKSKKQGFVSAQASSIENADASASMDPSKDEDVNESQPEKVPTTARTRTTRAAVTASQPSTDSNVPEPIQKPTSSPPKGTPSTVTKPTPLKLATVQPKKAVKAKPPPKPKAPKKSPQPTVAKEPTKEPTASSEPSATKKETPRKRKLMGLIVDDNAILATNDGETPVRQSRRIAQIKIKEEAERRKEEETALKQMKAASDKKKKVVDETYSAKSESDASEVDSEQKLEMKKKNKKKVKGANPWQTDSENAESDVSEEEHYESDHKLVFFKSDHEFSPESDIEDESQIVQTKRARTARKDDEHEIIDDGYACQKCKKHDHPDWILLCDKCDKGYHCSCLIPMLFIIPEGDWFCPPCQQEKLIETLEGQLQNLDKDLKEKELEEIRRQRAAFISISAANVLPDEVDEIETEYQKPKSIRKRPTTSRRRRRNDASDRSNGSSSSSSGSSRSEKSGKSSSGSNSSDDEPIYKLRKRRQTNVSYRFNEYDDLINSAIKKEMDSAEGAGNLGRGKDISTIMEADKEEKRIKQLEDDDDDDDADDKNVSSNANDVEMKSEEADVNEMKTKSESNAKASASDSDSEPIRKTLKRPLSNKSKKKHRKLNSLDIESEDDGSDDDFRTSSFSEDEEDENFSAGSESDSSLDAYRKKNKKHETRRPVRSRRKRYDDAFINDSDGDDVDEPKVTTRKKKKKEDSDFSEFNENESTDEEAEEDVDSDDLCDSTDSNESDRGWRSKKAKKSNQKKPRPATDASSNAPKTMPKKKVKKVEDTAFRAGIPKSKGKSISDESDDEDVQAKSRRTRGKKLTYLNLLDEFDSDSDSDGIKPGVKRPDTPPEERAAFIKKQEEIKRMLAEKNTEAAAALAAPKLTGSTPEKARRPAGPVDSLSTIPRQIIQNAKALDPDYKKGRESDDTDGFDDDLPDDFDAEGMDEDEIAKMMEEEDFAQQQLKAVGERVRKMKEAELLLNKKKEATKVTETSVITPIVPPVHIPAHLATPPSVVVPPSSFSPRPSMPLSHLIRPPHSSPLSPGNIQHMQPHHPQHSPHSPHGSQHMPIHPHLPPHGPHPPHHLAALNQAHQMVRGPPHHLLHPSQHSMQHFNPLQRHPMQLTQSPHISPNSQPPHMQHRPIHPSIRSPHHHPLQMHPSQMQSHLPPSMVADYPGDPKMMKLTKSGVEPKKRGRKSKAELQAIEQAKGIPDPSTSMGPSLLQHTAHAPGQEPIIPTTVLAVQNTRLMDPSELGPPGASVSDVKKRGRRKKFTPLRESLNKSGVEAPPSGLEQKTNPILAERLGIQDNRSNLSIATPPQLFSPSTVGQPSVITRLPRPPLGSPYGPGGPQRFYPPQPGQPPVSIAQSTRIPFSPHGPPPPLTSSPAPSSNGAPATNHYVQSEQMSRQSASLSAHFRSPAPAHFSGQPPNYQPAPGMPALIHRGGLQPIDRSIEGAPSTPQDYSTPAVPIPYAASYGTYYPPHHPANVEHRPQPPPPQQQPTTTTAPSPLAPANSSFEQFDNAKNTPPHDRATPNSYQSPPTTEEPAASSSEFSGLVSYFSSQQDDLET